MSPSAHDLAFHRERTGKRSSSTNVLVTARREVELAEVVPAPAHGFATLCESARVSVSITYRHVWARGGIGWGDLVHHAPPAHSPPCFREGTGIPRDAPKRIRTSARLQVSASCTNQGEPAGSGTRRSHHHHIARKHIHLRPRANCFATVSNSALMEAPGRHRRVANIACPSVRPAGPPPVSGQAAQPGVAGYSHFDIPHLAAHRVFTVKGAPADSLSRRAERTDLVPLASQGTE